MTIDGPARRSSPTPFLWFDGRAEEAAQFYVSVFPGSRITSVSRHGTGGRYPAGTALVVAFELDGQPFYALNAGPEFIFNESVSFLTAVDTQQEIDRLWAALSDGGRERDCGWVQDRYGLSWQVVPRVMMEIVQGADRSRADRAMAAMLTMRRFDIAAILAAADGDPAGA